MAFNIQNEFIRQYNHAFRVYEEIVKGFDPDSWNHIGRKQYTPARISYHILHSIKYYLEDKSTLLLESKKIFEIDWETAPVESLFSQEEIIFFLHEIQKRTEKWLQEIQYDQKNTAFEWAGETKLGIVVFSLRHFLYHLGEISCLLNESTNGNTEDIYVKV